MRKYVKPTSVKKARVNQPTKDSKPKKTKVTKEKANNKQVVYKSQKIVPTKENTIKEGFIRRNDTPKERKHPEFGTSKLEEKFAKNFLDKIGIEYDYQFKAESIGRYYDFYIPSANIIIEVNGGYWHSDPRLYEGKELTPTQKKNKRVDADKKKWADWHKIPIYYFWEKDINETPLKVFETLKGIINVETEKYNKIIEKKNRPIKK